jgi:hypothetical protein
MVLCIERGQPIRRRRGPRDDHHLGILALCTLMRCAVLAPILVVLGTLTASAQSNSSKLVATDLLNQYALIKSTIKPHRDWYEHPPDDREARYNLADCGGMVANLGLPNSTDPTTSALSFIAASYYKWVTALPMAGYPLESIAPLIQDYEKTLLRHVISKGGKNITYDTWRREGEKLATKINVLRSRQHLKAKQVEYEDECGGPGIEIRFIIPKGAHMFMIATFFSELCQKQGIDPSDRVTCNRYVEVPNGTTDKFSGFYMYLGEWADGYKRTGHIDAARVSSEGGARVFRLTK